MSYLILCGPVKELCELLITMMRIFLQWTLLQFQWDSELHPPYLYCIQCKMGSYVSCSVFSAGAVLLEVIPHFLASACFSAVLPTHVVTPKMFLHSDYLYLNRSQLEAVR